MLSLKRKVIFEKKRHCGKLISGISELFIRCNTDSCFEEITSGANIYLNGLVKLLLPRFVFLCVFLCVCDIMPEYQQNPHVSDSSKLDALLHKTHSKILLVLRFNGVTCVGP